MNNWIHFNGITHVKVIRRIRNSNFVTLSLSGQCLSKLHVNKQDKQQSSTRLTSQLHCSNSKQSKALIFSVGHALKIAFSSTIKMMSCQAVIFQLSILHPLHAISMTWFLEVVFSNAQEQNQLTRPICRLKLSTECLALCNQFMKICWLQTFKI